MNETYKNLNKKERLSALEALIFASSSEDNMSIEHLLKILNSENKETENAETSNEILVEQDILQMINDINVELIETHRPYRIVRFGGSYQFATLPQYGDLVSAMYAPRLKKRLTNSQLETLSIIAYKQPVTKQEVDKIRGVVSSSEIINTLVEREFVRICGRKDTIGKPLLYETTDDFLRTFGLNSLSDLPKLKELEDIAKEKMAEDEEQMVILDMTEDEPIKASMDDI